MTKLNGHFFAEVMVPYPSPTANNKREIYIYKAYVINLIVCVWVSTCVRMCKKFRITKMGKKSSYFAANRFIVMMKIIPLPATVSTTTITTVSPHSKYLSPPPPALIPLSPKKSSKLMINDFFLLFLLLLLLLLLSHCFECFLLHFFSVFIHISLWFALYFASDSPPNCQISAQICRLYSSRRKKQQQQHHIYENNYSNLRG